MRRIVPVVVLGLMGWLLAGCSAYLPEYAYFPRPGVVLIPQNLQPPASQPSTQPAVAPNEPAAMTVLATVVGVRREDVGKHLPQAVELRLRLENGAMPATFDPAQVKLVTGSLVALGPPMMVPAEPMALAPGQEAAVLAIFPLPAGFSDSTLDLSGLRLSVPVTISGRAVQAGINFQLVLPAYYGYGSYPYYNPYYGPYYYPYPTFYGGVIFHEGGRHR